MKSQPTWAWKKPLTSANGPSPWPWWGLCGSPSLSEHAWCLRWSATQEMIGPSIAIDPRTAQTARVFGPVLKARWVNRRCSPTVTPSVVAT